uniref:RNA silencing suppressor n=1 Tax=Tagetes carlavirus 1 TaxID=2794422 RepID=A0A7T5QZ74_9VIRU|nr:NABP [Tagetes carlavirus 1]
MRKDDPKFKIMIVLCNMFASRGNSIPIHIVVDIYMRAMFDKRVGHGLSKYARRRRAVAIGRCERCYRVYPGGLSKKCDNRTCVPGISSNEKVVNFIKFGSSRGDTHPGLHF